MKRPRKEYPCDKCGKPYDWLWLGMALCQSCLFKVRLLCNSIKCGEFNILICVREYGHDGYHNYVVRKDDK